MAQLAESDIRCDLSKERRQRIEHWSEAAWRGQSKRPAPPASPRHFGARPWILLRPSEKSAKAECPHHRCRRVCFLVGKFAAKFPRLAGATPPRLHNWPPLSDA